MRKYVNMNIKIMLNLFIECWIIFMLKKEEKSEN